MKLLNHNHEELFSSKTKVRQEFRFFFKRDKSESLALLVIRFLSWPSACRKSGASKNCYCGHLFCPDYVVGICTFGIFEVP